MRMRTCRLVSGQCIRFLSVEQIAAWLDDRFRQLTAGRRTAPPRHRVLNSVNSPLLSQPGGRWSSGSATDAVADVGGLRCVDHPHDLQLDARWQYLE